MQRIPTAHNTPQSKNCIFWVNPYNPGFDFKERVKRHISMMEEAMRYKWPLWNGHLVMRLYEKAIIKFENTNKIYVPLTQVK
jgi:hypothetical protein